MATKRTKLTRAERKKTKKLVETPGKIISVERATITMVVDGQHIQMTGGLNPPWIRVLPPPGRLRLLVMRADDEPVEVSYDEWLKIKRAPRMPPDWRVRHTLCMNVVGELEGTPNHWCFHCETFAHKSVYEGTIRPEISVQPSDGESIRQQASFGRQFEVISSECAPNWARCLGWNLFFPAAYRWGKLNKMGAHWEFMPILVDQFLEIGAAAFAVKVDERTIDQMNISEREFLDV